MSVCIVGNSDNVIGTNLGSLVDSCDTVIRINDFLISDHETDVGEKTSVVACAFSGDNKIVSDDTWPTRSLLEKTEVWMLRIPRHDRVSRAHRCNLKMDQIKTPTQLLYDTLIAEVYSKFWRKEPSSGLVTIAMAIESFPGQKIYIHGFDSRTGKEGKRHYFDPNYFDVDMPNDPVGHDWASENLYIQSLINNQTIWRLS